jgi:Zn-dependent peptidase ImmA (M78 family)
LAKKYRYGFKAEANRFAHELRVELEILPEHPLCPWLLAEHLAVPILKFTELPDCGEKLYLMKGKGKKEFSATVCYDGFKAFIVNNDVHEAKRQASNVAHELAHILLGHPPARPFDEDGKREFLAEIEDEAEWLGPALLVSEEAAINAYKLIQSKTYTLSSLSDEWKVTEDVLRMRMNLVGARKRFRQAA